MTRKEKSLVRQLLVAHEIASQHAGHGGDTCCWCGCQNDVHMPNCEVLEFWAAFGLRSSRAMVWKRQE
jgi:hypothetical protein